MGKRIAIIGAGSSGLTAIKCCLDEGLQPVCYERTIHLGGLWNYQEGTDTNRGCVMKTTVINTSKEVMNFSDFLIPKEFPNHMHHTKVYEYLRLYAKEFDLEKHIKYQTEILNVKRVPEFDQTGQWMIKIKDKTTGKEVEEVFDGVMLCSGHHTYQNWAKFAGEDYFKGKRTHTHDYKNHRGYEDKRVVVIGIGNSGVDVACDLSKISKQVYLSTRRGAWVAKRVSVNGIPVDWINRRRFRTNLLNCLPFGVKSSMVEKNLNLNFDHELYGVKPKHRFFSQHPTISDELANRISCGTVIVKPNINTITETGVEFDDGTFVDDIDAIIYATGYRIEFPYLEEDVIEVNDNQVELYKYVFPPKLWRHPTIAVIGLVQPLGALFPISEMQCRWVARVFKGDIPLPSPQLMCQEIDKTREDMQKRYVNVPRHTIQVDFIQYMDDIAEHTGCMPNLLHLCFLDPKIAWLYMFQATIPSIYRLQGHGAWRGARNAVITAWDRVKYPLSKNYEPPRQIHWQIVLLCVFIYILYQYFLQ